MKFVNDNELERLEKEVYLKAYLQGIHDARELVKDIASEQPNEIASALYHATNELKYYWRHMKKKV